MASGFNPLWTGYTTFGAVGAGFDFAKAASELWCTFTWMPAFSVNLNRDARFRSSFNRDARPMDWWLPFSELKCFSVYICFPARESLITNAVELVLMGSSVLSGNFESHARFPSTFEFFGASARSGLSNRHGARSPYWSCMFQGCSLCILNQDSAVLHGLVLHFPVQGTYGVQVLGCPVRGACSRDRCPLVSPTGMESQCTCVPLRVNPW